MTEVAQAPVKPLAPTLPQIRYQVAMPNPETHLFEVTLNLTNWSLPQLDLKLPVWTPGSYLVREYAKHLQDFSAQTQAGKTLSWRKLSKNHWQVETSEAELTVCYRIFANELSVRTNHLDPSHGYFNPGAMFCYIPGWEHCPVTVTVVPPQNTQWQVTTPLNAISETPQTFVAPDFDTLVDSPFEIGTQTIYEFEVLGKPHQLAVWGQGNFDATQIIEDTQKIIEVEAELFGGLPYDRYLFLLHLSTQGNGGLEHKTSCSLNYPRFGFRSAEKYNRFINLVAHEFFHLWNVKRIRPKALETFDYDGENYTPSLWFSEGMTSYYDQIIPLRAGIYDAKWYLKLLSETITRLQTTPGRLVQPLGESSFDAWIKLYRPDANSRNAQISYYLKGELVSLLLDLLIRQRHNNQRSLDDVMRQMWQQFGRSETGFTPEQLQTVFETVAETDLSDFFQQYLHSTAELPFNDYLAPFGLEVKPEIPEDQPPYLGLSVKSDSGAAAIKSVDAGSPAQRAGIDAGDELLAIDGFRVSAEQLNERLKDYQAGDTMQITVFHRDQLSTCEVTLADPQANRYQVQAIAQPDTDQQEKFQGWLGAPLSEVSGCKESE